MITHSSPTSLSLPAELPFSFQDLVTHHLLQEAFPDSILRQAHWLPPQSSASPASSCHSRATPCHPLLSTPDSAVSGWALRLYPEGGCAPPELGGQLGHRPGCWGSGKRWGERARTQGRLIGHLVHPMWKEPGSPGPWARWGRTRPLLMATRTGRLVIRGLLCLCSDGTVALSAPSSLSQWAALTLGLGTHLLLRTGAVGLHRILS